MCCKWRYCSTDLALSKYRSTPYQLPFKKMITSKIKQNNPIVMSIMMTISKSKKSTLANPLPPKRLTPQPRLRLSPFLPGRWSPSVQICQRVPTSPSCPMTCRSTTPSKLCRSQGVPSPKKASGLVKGKLKTPKPLAFWAIFWVSMAPILPGIPSKEKGLASKGKHEDPKAVFFKRASQATWLKKLVGLGCRTWVQALGVGHQGRDEVSISYIKGY